jgi:DNA-binding HxlR family transcriptional regulator
VSRDVATYGHFCSLARALEKVGDRWALLVVRDLATGPKRFTDLADRLGGITPKTLTQRLRDLEAEGLVTADRVPGRREVWYELTPPGEDLRPILDDLLLWGLRHAIRQPEPGEPVHPEHLLWALRVMLERLRPTRTARWLFRLAEGGAYTLANDGDGWQLAESESDATADVVITTTRAGLARLLTTPPPRDAAPADVDIAGTHRAVQTFLKTIAVFPLGDGPAPAATRDRHRPTDRQVIAPAAADRSRRGDLA